MNWYALLADFVAVIHCGYVAVVVLGLLAILLGGFLGWRFIRNFWFRSIHMTMIMIVVVQALLGLPCPLTVWEFDLRIAAGQENVSEETFIARLIHPIMFLDLPPIVLRAVHCLFGLIILASWWVYPPNLPKWKKRC